MPQILKFTGEHTGDYEGFQEWREQFELISEACHWTEQAKLVNLTTRLKGQVYSFYRSCTPNQRTSYSSLVEALKKRYTPVRLQAVQSSLFHERKQSPQESVDAFAQDLKRLFCKAYPNTLQGSHEAEEFGESVLASQFVTGLHRKIKLKLAGHEGNIEQLLTKARFEEAKIKELGGPNSGETPKAAHQSGPSGPSQPTRKEPPRQHQDSSKRTRDWSRDTCHGCGGTGHFIRQCPYRNVTTKETHGQTPNKVATVTIVPTQEPTPPQDPDSPAEDKWQDSAIEQALNSTLVTVHGVESEVKPEGSILGPIPTTTVMVEGKPAKALVDTGSPVSILSLEFLIKTLPSKEEGQSQEAI